MRAGKVLNPDPESAEILPDHSRERMPADCADQGGSAAEEGKRRGRVGRRPSRADALAGNGNLLIASRHDVRNIGNVDRTQADEEPTRVFTVERFHANGSSFRG